MNALSHELLPHQGRRRQAGSVLIVVMVICLGLVSMTLVFGHAMLLSYRGTDNELAARQADAAILGAEKYAESVLSQAQTPNVLPDRSRYQNAAVPTGDALFWFIGQPLAGDPTDKPAFALVDEASKLNLNAASAYMLSQLPNMTSDVAQEIVAWRGQAAGTTTVSLDEIKSAPYESPEELALVDPALDPSVLYGDDHNFNHCLDPQEGSSSGGGSPGDFAPGLLEYVTTFSREPNTAPDGTTKGNVLAGVSQNNRGLITALTKALGSGRAQAIIASIPVQRNGQPQPIASVVAFCDQAKLSDGEWDQVAPYLTMGTGAYCVGLVNVNTASATVLACLPTMTPDLATKLVAARAQLATPSTNLKWIVPVLGQTVAEQAGRWLTTRSYQVSVDVAAVGRYGRGYRRTLFVLDSSATTSSGSSGTSGSGSGSGTVVGSSSSGNGTGTGTPQIVYRRNLTGLGWALGSDVRASLAAAAGNGGAAAAVAANGGLPPAGGAGSR